MIVTNEGLLAPSSIVMRSENYVRPYATRIRDEPGSATETYGFVVAATYDWFEGGNHVLTPRGVKLDLFGSDNWQVPYVLPVDGRPIFRELPRRGRKPEFRLLEPASAFKEDPKRTMLRIMAKADGMDTELDIRLLSAMFWVAAYCEISDAEV